MSKLMKVNFCCTCKHWKQLHVSENPLVTKYHDFPTIPIAERTQWGSCDEHGGGCAYGNCFYCASWAYGRKDKHVTHNKSKNGFRQPKVKI